MSPVQRYYADESGQSWVARGRSPIPVDPGPGPDPGGSPGDGWWPSDLGTPLSLAQLRDPDNFGPPPGFTYPNTLAASTIVSSGIKDFTGYHFTGLSGSNNQVLAATDTTFTNCLWDDFPAFGLGASNVVLNHCASRKLIIVSGASDIRYNMHRLTGIAGTDAIHITNDRAGHAKPVDITFNGIHAVGDKDSYISGGNHMDSIQTRGVDRLVLHNFCFDHGTVFDTLFNATVFVQDANGGSTKVLINNGYSRSQGYRHFMLMGAEQQVSNMWFADTGHSLLHDGGTGQIISVETNNRWENGDPIPTLFGA